MALLGLTPADFKREKFDLWPENWPAVELFLRVHNQWRTGPGGAFALDYGVVFHELDRRDLAPDAYDDLLDDLRVIEGAALDEMHKD